MSTVKVRSNNIKAISSDEQSQSVKFTEAQRKSVRELGSVFGEMLSSVSTIKVTRKTPFVKVKDMPSNLKAD